MAAEFEVKADRERLQTLTLTLTHDGVTRDGVAVPVSVTFEQE